MLTKNVARAGEKEAIAVHVGAKVAGIGVVDPHRLFDSMGVGFGPSRASADWLAEKVRPIVATSRLHIHAMLCAC